MKATLSILFFMCAFGSFAQMNQVAIAKTEIKKLKGTWSGLTVVTAQNRQQTYKVLLEVTDLLDSMLLNFNRTDEKGNVDTIKYNLAVFGADDKLSFENFSYEIVFVRKRGQSLSIIAERTGYLNNRLIDYQVTLSIGISSFNIVNNYRFSDMMDYSIGSRSAFVKIK